VGRGKLVSQESNPSSEASPMLSGRTSAGLVALVEAAGAMIAAGATVSTAGVSLAGGGGGGGGAIGDEDFFV